MISIMDVEPKAQICDTRPTLAQSAISQRSIDLQLTKQSSIDKDLAKKTMKLDLGANYNTRNKVKDVDSADKKGVKSPKSPLSNSGARMVSQSSISSQIDVVEDRKALRDALYQGIFHRHRRTIFAFGSFLRMLRSRNSQYNTIRSSSEGEDDGR